MEKKKKHKINKYTAVVNSEEFIDFLDSIECQILKSVTENLKRNIKLLSSSLILPVQFVHRGVESVDFLERFRTALINFKPEDRTKENIEKEMQRLDDERQMSEISHTFDILDKMIENDEQIAKALENMFRLNTLHLWTIFEVYSQDLWIQCVNAFPETLGKGAFEHKREKCTNQLIKEFIGNNFKLNYKKSMGDFLAEHIDFSGVKDITKAYKTAFGTTFKPIEQEFINNTELMNLQLIRNQIIHKSGIVDKHFLATANNLEYNIGDVIEVDGKQYAKISDSVLKALRSLTEYVISNISKNNK